MHISPGTQKNCQHLLPPGSTPRHRSDRGHGRVGVLGTVQLILMYLYCGTDFHRIANFGVVHLANFDAPTARVLHAQAACATQRWAQGVRELQEAPGKSLQVICHSCFGHMPLRPFLFALSLPGRAPALHHSSIKRRRQHRHRRRTAHLPSPRGRLLHDTGANSSRL